ncbi:hypothetical protein Rt10032_c13g5162 [Rhodotorula toruloides]|uniref:FCP1 homology domain-containing protein n=1 Tax=Rhodotorula toruloides TaxID=5286 RepID=A0A511KMM0_RHOTO|nr:hypothetical protein Rt10032_c13g5162 [Rhodotorula toruloides]
MQPIKATGLFHKEERTPPAVSPATEPLLSPQTQPLFSPRSTAGGGDTPRASENMLLGSDSWEDFLSRFGGLTLPREEESATQSTRRGRTGGLGQPHARKHQPSGQSGTSLKPSKTYDDISLAPSKTVSDPSTLDPLIVVLNLNHTLLYRASRTTKGSKRPTYRPYLSTFLEWVCKANLDSDDGARRRRQLEVVVYTATRAHNALTLLEGMGLIPSAFSALGTNLKHESLVDLVLSREDLDLSPTDFGSDIDTIKDLRRAWKKFGISEEEGARRTVLLCDDKGDAALQPYSHLPISPFVPSLSHPDADPSLLHTISSLSLLSRETNIASFIRSGCLKEREVDEEEMGRRECEKEGVRVQSVFDAMWWTRVSV